MNHQSEKFLELAIKELHDEGVFSEDQLTTLIRVVSFIHMAMSKESDCISSGIDHNYTGQ